MTKSTPLGPDLFSQPVARPTVITQEEYEAKYKPQGWRLLIIGPTATWRQDWGIWEAIRDIVQNSLDETERYDYGYDTSGLWIADKGKGVAIDAFLLGPPKAKPDYARGKFGEGMKIAALTLLRAGYSVRVETADREVWIVFLEQKINGRVQQLAALWKPTGRRVGTKFHILGYTGTAYAENFTINLPKSLLLWQTESVVSQPVYRYNQLFRKEGGAKGKQWNPLDATLHMGRLYCRDIWLRDIPSPFSYNLWGFELAPDRHGPNSETDMYEDMGRLWMGVTNNALLKELIKLVLDPPQFPMKDAVESRNLTLTKWSGDSRWPSTGTTYTQFMREHKELWQRAWSELLGKAAVLRTEPRYDGMVQHLGHKSYPVQSNVRDGFAMVIKSDTDLMKEMAERLDQAKRVHDDHLSDKQRAHLMLARRIASDFRGIGPINAGHIPAASDMMSRTAGLYEFGTGMIKIDLEQLEGAQKTVGVMIHELGHHVAYMHTRDIERSSDLTKAHAEAMEEVAGQVAQRIANGNYDRELADPDLSWW